MQGPDLLLLQCRDNEDTYAFMVHGNIYAPGLQGRLLKGDTVKKIIFARTMELLASVVFVLTVTSAAVHAGPAVTQTFNLHPGWNAIFLEVQPEQNDMEVLLQGLPLAGIWTWVPRGIAMQYVQDPSEKLLGIKGWHVYFPKSRGEVNLLSNLFALQANRAYLVEIQGNNNVTWTVTGRPSLRRQTWEPNSFNLTGFPINSTGSPSFAGFFAGSQAHAGQVIYRLSDAGIWELVQNPAAVQMRSGEAFWIYTEGASTYSGPIAVRTDFGDGLDFLKVINENKLWIKNVSPSTKTVEVRYMPMGLPVPLVRLLVGPNGGITWPSFNAAETFTIAAGQEKLITFSLNRAGMSAPRTESMIEIRDDAGSRYLVPVSAEKGGF